MRPPSRPGRACSPGQAWGGALLATTLLLGGCATGGALDGAGAGASASAQAPVVVRAPAWRVGSQWQYSDGYGLRVTRVDGPVTTFARLDDPSQWVARRGFLREDAQSATTLRRLLFEDLPSGAGGALSSAAPLTYRREYSADGTQRTHATSWSVEGRERVKVPAGEFDCDVLVMRTRDASSNWTGFERWWYSPAAQNYVRMEYRYGAAAPGSRVLLHFELAGPTPLAP